MADVKRKFVPHPVFVFLGEIPEGLQKVLGEHGVAVVSCEKEDCGGSSFNDAKYLGFISWQVSTGIPVVVPRGTVWMTKKGKFQVPSSLEYRIRGSRREWFAYYLVILEGEVPDGDSPLIKWMGENGTVIDEKTLLEVLERKPMIGSNPLYEIDVSTTCGWMAKFPEGEKNRVGHLTGVYGISRLEALEWIAKNGKPIGQVYDGFIVGLTLVGTDKKGETVRRPGGQIVGIPGLGGVSHVTDNTEVKSSLSGPILQKWFDGVREFPQQEVDPVCKTETTIVLEKVGETKVTITGFYYYVVDPPKVVEGKKPTESMASASS